MKHDMESIDNDNEYDVREFIGKKYNAKSLSLKTMVKTVLITAIVVIILMLVASAAFHLKLAKKKDTITIAESGDTLVLDPNNNATIVQFQEAVLGKSEQLKKLEVYTREISDIVTITDPGFINLDIFKKYQIITYHGSVVYTVDLSEITPEDITIDEEKYTITMAIPRAVQEEINIPEDAVEFGEVKKGKLAFGNIETDPTQYAKIVTEAKSKMQNQLDESNEIDRANDYAKMSVLQIYQPIIKSVSDIYSLEIEFKE